MNKIYLAAICIGVICFEYAVYAHNIHSAADATISILIGVLGLKLEGWRIWRK